MIRLLVLVLCLQAPALWAQEYPAFHAVTGVAADDVLNLRAQPDATAPILGALPPDATGVEVVAVQDGWAAVTVGEVTGHASLRYLVREAGPDWNALETGLICLGTEPFWSLEIDPAKGVATYRSPEDAAPNPSPLTETWPGTPWAPTAAIAFSDGFAVLRPAACSDGMSDRGYGISVDVFLQGSGSGARRAGCCRLAPP